MNYLKNIRIDIDILLMILEDLERDHRRLWNQCFPRTKLTASYSGMPNSPSLPLPFDYVWEQLKKIETRMTDIQEQIERKKATIEVIKQKMSELTGLEQRVAYMRDVEGKSLKAIAKELNYSLGWIKKVSMNTNKEPTRNPTIA